MREGEVVESVQSSKSRYIVAREKYAVLLASRATHSRICNLYYCRKIYRGDISRVSKNVPSDSYIVDTSMFCVDVTGE